MGSLGVSFPTSWPEGGAEVVRGGTVWPSGAASLCTAAAISGIDDNEGDLGKLPVAATAVVLAAHLAGEVPAGLGDCARVMRGRTPRGCSAPLPAGLEWASVLHVGAEARNSKGTLATSLGNEAEAAGRGTCSFVAIPAEIVAAPRLSVGGLDGAPRVLFPSRVGTTCLRGGCLRCRGSLPPR